jgi:hypothetical protein
MPAVVVFRREKPTHPLNSRIGPALRDISIHQQINRRSVYLVLLAKKNHHQVAKNHHHHHHQVAKLVAREG